MKIMKRWKFLAIVAFRGAEAAFVFKKGANREDYERAIRR